MKDVLLQNAFLGVIIGILTSCPMGPVGVLCVRRTLSRGQNAGMLTGLGAALSDTTYASIVYLGVGLVISLIETYQSVLTIVGSLLILAFGIFLYATPPRYDSKDNEKSSQYNTWQILVSSFFLTLSNPTIIFFFIAFFGRYNFVHQTPFYWGVFVYSMCFIFIGALLWWALLTTIVSLFRKKIGLASLRTFNQLVALVFIVVALIGLGSALFGK